MSRVKTSYLNLIARMHNAQDATLKIVCDAEIKRDGIHFTFINWYRFAYFLPAPLTGQLQNDMVAILGLDAENESYRQVKSISTAGPS